jgi:GT2 family glycosyltransferase
LYISAGLRTHALPLVPPPGVCQDDGVNEIDPYAVVIVTHNHADTLEACLTAVERLEPEPARVVIVDNASPDGSADVADAHSAGIASLVVREQHNTGFAAAANRGIGETSTPWVLLLNPDCAPRPDLVRSLLEALAGQPAAARVGALSPKLVRARGPGLEPQTVIDAAGMIVTCSGRHLDRAAGTDDDGSHDTKAWVFGGTAAALLLRREALQDIAYDGTEFFAESFFAYREDAELAWRLQLRGWRCLYVPSAVAVHRRGFRPETGRRNHSTINRHSVRNRFLLRWHCADLGWHLRCFPSWLARDLMVVAACLTVERSSLPALADLWRLRADAARRRRWVLDRRTVSTRQIGAWFRRKGRVLEVEVP